MPSASSSPPADPIDPYVLEFVVNMRWLLCYAAHFLDPTVEERYPRFVADVSRIEETLAHMNFETSCTLADVPFGLLRLSRASMLYLLVCDHLLGGCPPTMHPFLLRAYRDGDSITKQSPARPLACAGWPEPSSDSACRHSRQGNTDLNVSFPSEEGSAGESDAARGADGMDDITELDAKPVGQIDSRALRRQSPASSPPLVSRASQAALILVRWLLAEGVLSEGELAATVSLDSDSHSTHRLFSGGLPTNEDPKFQLHQRLAQRLSEVRPFYLGAHLLISRSIFLQYSAILLTVEAVMEHVSQLQIPLHKATLKHRSSDAAVAPPPSPPPTSVEAALLEWFQAVLDSATVCTSGSASPRRRLACCPTLMAFLQHGPFCHDTLDPSERDFFRLVQSGECVCVALAFYSPDALPLVELSRALRHADAFVEAETGAQQADEDAAEGKATTGTAELRQRYESLCYWAAIFAAARFLGVLPTMTPEEVVAFGRTALPLHLFVFVQQLFAVLATSAEEEVRVSADTAWWEHMGNSDGYTELMDERNAEATASGRGTSTSRVSPSSAQVVLRESMRQSFPPEAFHRARKEEGETAVDSEAGKEEEEEVPIVKATDARAVAIAKNDESLTAGQVITQTSISVQPNQGHSAAEARILGHAVAASSSVSSASSSTKFSVEVAHTQRDDLVASPAADSDALETPAAVLRPMMRSRLSCTNRRRRTSTVSVTADGQPFHAAERRPSTTLTSADAYTVEWAAQRHAVDRRPPSAPSASSTSAHGKDESGLGADVVDTYVGTPVEDDRTNGATLALVNDVEAAVLVQDTAPKTLVVAAADALLHSRVVEEELRRSRHALSRLSLAKNTAPSLQLHRALSAHSMRSSARGSSPVTVLSLVPPETQSVGSAPAASQPPTTPLRTAADKLVVDTAYVPATLKDESVSFVRNSGGAAAPQQSTNSSLMYSTDFVVRSVDADAPATPTENANGEPAERDASMQALVVSASFVPYMEPTKTASPLLLLPEAAEHLSSSRAASSISAEEDSDGTCAKVEHSNIGRAVISTADLKERHSTMIEDEDVIDRSESEDVWATSARVVTAKKRTKEKVTEASSSSVMSATTTFSSSAAQVVPPSRVAEVPQAAASLTSLPRTSSSPERGEDMNSEKDYVHRHAYETASNCTDVDERVASAPQPAGTVGSPRGSSSPDTGSFQVHNEEGHPFSPSPPSSSSTSVEDIAVEYDKTSDVSHRAEEGAASPATSDVDLFSTITEREAADRANGAAAQNAGNTSSSSSQEQIPQLHSAPIAILRRASPQQVSHASSRESPLLLDEDAALPPSQDGEAEVVVDTLDVQHRTMSDASNLDGLSPLTPTATESISAVYGTDCPSIYDDGMLTSSTADGPRRLDKQWEEESWFSSVSHPNRHSTRPADGSPVSVAASGVSSVRDTSQVRHLVQQLSTMNPEEWRSKGKEELCEALARQQQMVQELKLALQESRSLGRRSRAARVPSPGERRRQVQIRSPSEERPEMVESASRGRASLASVATAPSQVSVAQSRRSDASGQLAETDLTSTVGDMPLSGISVSPFKR